MIAQLKENFTQHVVGNQLCANIAGLLSTFQRDECHFFACGQPAPEIGCPGPHWPVCHFDSGQTVPFRQLDTTGKIVLCRAHSAQCILSITQAAQRPRFSLGGTTLLRIFQRSLVGDQTFRRTAKGEEQIAAHRVEFGQNYAELALFGYQFRLIQAGESVFVLVGNISLGRNKMWHVGIFT